MLADRTTRAVVHHEWRLQCPAHYTDVADAINAAVVARDNDRATGVGSVTVTTRDGLIVIGYQADQPPPPKAGRAGFLGEEPQR